MTTALTMTIHDISLERAVLNRPDLTMGNTIIGAFGGHCDNFNYTGMLVGVSKTAGIRVTSIPAMEASSGE
jgi:hypothetical protein